MFSLRKSLYITTSTAALILCAVLLMGLRQYSLADRYDAIINQSEKLIFQFATIRDLVTESLLEERYQKLDSIVAEVETLHAGLSTLLESSLIPGEYKLAIVSQVDLAGIVLLLRRIKAESGQQALAKELNGKIRLLGDRLMRFDRIIVGQAKATLVQFQSVVIGGLAIVLCMFSFLLVLWYRKLAVPLILMTRHFQDDDPEKPPLMIDMQAFDEITLLAGTFVDLQQDYQGCRQEETRSHVLLEAVEKIGHAALRAENAAALAATVCRTLLANPAYALIWLGVPDGEDLDRLKPLAVDGSTTMDRKEYEECLEVLLAQARQGGRESNPVMKAFDSGSFLVIRDFFANAPKGLLKHTPLSSGKVDYAILPLCIDSETVGVLSIYAAAEHVFESQEMALLNLLAREIAWAIRFIQHSHQFHEVRLKADLLFEQTDTALILIDKSGEVVELNDATGRLLGKERPLLQGRDFVSLFFLDLSGPGAKQCADAVKSEIPVTFIAHSDLFDEQFSFMLTCSESGDNALRAVAVQSLRNQTGGLNDFALKMSSLAAVGDVTAGVAHEISNLVNGIINYGQILVDEFVQQGTEGGKSELALNMIQNGERIARLVQQILFLAHDQGTTRKQVPMGTVVNEALSLIEQQLKNDGIIYKVHVPADLPMVHINKEHMCLVLLNLLINARQALKVRFPGGKHEGKKMEIRGEVVFFEGRNWLRCMITDWGVGVEADILPRLSDPFFSTRGKGQGAGLGLTISKHLVEEDGGRLSIKSIPGEKTSVLIDLPVASGS